MRKKVDIPAALRWEVWERDGFICRYCDNRKNLHVDHVIPESKGGPTTPENLATICGTCNRRKGAKTHSEFQERLDIGWAVKSAWADLCRESASFSDFDIRRVAAEYFQMVQLLRSSGIFLGFYADTDAEGRETEVCVVKHSPPNVYAELIRDRRRRGRHREAERFEAMAAEQFGLGFLLPPSEASLC